MKALEEQLAEAQAETAACLEFLRTEMGWEDFRAEMLYADDAKRQSASLENARKLRDYLGDSGHGKRLLMERDTYARLFKEALDILRIYADPKNWQCNRCKGQDHINCFMGRWAGPIGDCTCGAGKADLVPCLEDRHGYTVAARALAELEPVPKPAGASSAQKPAVELDSGI